MSSFAKSSPYSSACVLDNDVDGRYFTRCYIILIRRFAPRLTALRFAPRLTAPRFAPRSSQVMNSVTHGLGIILCVVGTILMSRKAVHSQR